MTWGNGMTRFMKIRWDRRISLLLPLFGAAALVGVGSWVTDVWADSYADPGGVPRLVPFRGHLEQSGAPVTSTVTASFTIYDAPAGGALLWGPETHTITPTAGDFTVRLGSSVRLSPSIVEGGDAYVEVAIGATVLGRQRLGAVPYALRAANGAPSGTIVAFGGSAVPEGWLACDGAALDAGEPRYEALFAAIGTTWGNGTSGSGATTGVTDFNIPDLRGRFLRSADPRAAGSRLSADVPGAVGVLQEDATALPNAAFTAASNGSHSHTYPVYPGSYNPSGEPAGDYNANGNVAANRPTSTDGAHTHSITGGDYETRPFSASVTHIIRL